ncbi:CPBP family intramembrane glutamic endopeptidase [Leadbetterella byssophila]|uniref:CPBP family intramembrane glutamic endopeptidase n=1 Tax=Leadbetterella byssophila TaxID=316068 RepID=UPI0039A0620B
MAFTTKTILPIILTIAFTIGLLFILQFSEKLGFVVSDNNYLTRQFNYQILLLPITAISILTTYLLNRQNFKTYFSFGQISAVGQELKLFGIKQGDTWAKTGLSLYVVISLVTATFLYFQLKQTNPNWTSLQSGLFWIVLFSLTNSFGEEMIFRLGIVSPLSGQLSPTTIFLISAVLFGIPHFAGMPNGIIGVTLAGILGFVLAKSMYETNGFFWAWTIHFLQDVLIIGTLYLMNE